MKHLKQFEDNAWGAYGSDIDNDPDEVQDDDAFLESPEYFVDTHLNGQFGQLREMLAMFREQGRMDELINYINQLGSAEIIDWIARN